MASEVGEPAQDSGPHSPELEAWRNLCHRLEAVGSELLQPPFPGQSGSPAGGFDHLARQLLTWLGWSIGYNDASAPQFMRQNDLVLQWGGPNVDNIYRHARIEPGHRYRITGKMHSCEEFVLALRAGFMHQPTWGTLVEITASSLGFGPGDDIDIVLGGDTSAGAVGIPDGVVMASIREYYFDWEEREPATLVIECLDPGPAVELSSADLVDRFDQAAAGVEHSMRYWNNYLNDYRSSGIDNEFCPAIKVAKGLDAARYSFCFWNLAPGETLVVEATVPDAKYWSVQTYSMHWFRSGDFGRHVTSLNHRQAHIGPDGRLRIVVAHTDPEVPNWIDTEGETIGMLSFRWFWGTDDPTVVTTVVPVENIRDHLPADTPSITPPARAIELAARRAHVAWRYRS